jgi:DNA-binding transcriptional MerR regulator
MRISELSAKTQVSVHRLRRYEADGLIALHCRVFATL